MPIFIFPLVAIALIFAGVWGSMILSAHLKRLPSGSDPSSDSGEIEELREGTHLLEARVERLEEDLSFFRGLYQSESPLPLPPADPKDPERTT